MKLSMQAVFARSASFETDEPHPYRADAPVAYVLQGGGERRKFSTDRNVFSLYQLEPDTEYTLEKEGEEAGRITFRTEKETVLFDITRFGAREGGEADCTAAIQAAIAACPKGGTVYVPKGTFLTGPLFLKSHMTLCLAKGAVLLGRTDRSTYPVLPGVTRNTDEKDETFLGTWEGNPLDSFASLLTFIGCEDTAVTGEGTIDGNAENSDWWTDWKKRRIAWRPNLLYFQHCRNVRIQGLHVQNSPSWTVHPCYSRDLMFINLSIQNPPDSPNTDGFDPESCQNVTLLGTVISVGDDCIAIKSGKLYMAEHHTMPTEHVRIRNCLLERGHGSVTVGSEIAGGVRDVEVSKCLFDRTDRGVRIKTRRGRGSRSVLTDLVFRDIRMRDVAMPVTINMFYFCDPDGHTEYVQTKTALPKDAMTPSIGKITLENIDAENTDAVFLCAEGLPESPIEEISLRSVHASYLPEKDQVPKVPVMMDGCAAVSGRGIFCRNVGRLVLHDVSLTGTKDSAPVLDHVSDTDMQRVRFA